MSDGTGIEWTDATWNPIVGCSVVSPGCKRCYAMRFAGARLQHVPAYAGLTQATKAGHVWTGEVRMQESVLEQPLAWRKGRRIFVNSMGDLFHEDVPDAWIDRVFAVMAACPQHQFQVLTKRAERMRRYVSALPQRPAAVCRAGEAMGLDIGRCTWPLPNVWLGVSAEDQERWDERVPHLWQTRAAIRFVSAEPLLGSITEPCFIADLDWLIVGGESGPRARPMHPSWPREMRDQCRTHGVPFFFKQWGEWAPMPVTEFDLGRGARLISPRGGACDPNHEADNGCQCEWMRRDGKKAAGRLLDGVTHDESPKP